MRGNAPGDRKGHDPRCSNIYYEHIAAENKQVYVKVSKIYVPPLLYIPGVESDFRPYTGGPGSN